MKLFLIAIIVVVVTVVYAKPQDKYTDRFDNIDIDEVLNSDRLLKNYVNCLKGGKCTPDGRELKRVLPEALETDCAKCSDRQKEGTRKVVIHLVNKKPDLWNELSGIYDPTGKYRTKYEQLYKDELGAAKL